MRRTKELIEELKKLDQKICKKYFPDYKGDFKDLRDDNVELVVQADMASALRVADDLESAYYDIGDMIAESSLGGDIMIVLNVDAAKEDAEIRRDFDAALTKAAKGTYLSGPLSWSFSNKDLKILAELHKAGKHRDKIEDLLEDCNFHYENGLLSEGEYDKLFAELDKA